MGGFKRRLMVEEESGRRRARLGEIAKQGLNVLCWCNRCGHRALVPTAELADRFGPAVPVPEIGAYLPCPGCGTHDMAACPAIEPAEEFLDAEPAALHASPAGRPGGRGKGPRARRPAREKTGRESCRERGS